MSKKSLILSWEHHQAFEPFLQRVTLIWVSEVTKGAKFKKFDFLTYSMFITCKILP